MTDLPSGDHPSADETAAYVDGHLPASDRARLERHLAGCPECQEEVVSIWRLTRRNRARQVWIPQMLVPLAAAALLLVVTTVLIRHPTGEGHREPAITLTPAPTPLAPVSRVTAVDTLRWTSVARADRYRVRLFDASGSVLLEQSTTDTILPLPGSIRLTAGDTYYWVIEARVGWDRWSASALTPFTPERGR